MWTDRSFQVDVNGSTWRRHVDQMKNTELPGNISEPPLPVYVPDVSLPKDISVPEISVETEKLAEQPAPLGNKHKSPLPKPDNTPHRYPQRIRKPTQKLDL